MRSQLQCVITAGLLCHLFLFVRPVTSQALPVLAAGTAQSPAEQAACHVVLTAPPAPSRKPGAPARRMPRIPISPDQPVEITAAQCEKVAETYTLRGDVKIRFADYVFQGDTVTYDPATGDASATGRAALDGGPRDIHLTGTHGAYNMRSQTGKFYDVAGTTGVRFRGTNVTLTSSSPLVFAAKVMEQTGPQEYVLHHGWVTSCELPRPKWRFHASKIILRVGDSAKIYTSTFRIKGVPILYLPYASTPAEKLGRQSGFLVPTFGTSNTKGTIVGESYYWAINRSMDTTVGAEYLSNIGWMLLGDYRAKPGQTSFLNLNYFQVLTNKTAPVTTTVNGVPSNIQVNEAGEDIKLNGAAVFAHNVRGVASIEYLSSFVFRQQFSPTFTQAVNSEVSSDAFVSKSTQGYSFNGYLARYQNFQSTAPDNVITILHTPGFELDGVEHKIPRTPVYWSYDLATEGLKRSEPGFVTPNLVARVDVIPTLSMPLVFRGWTFRPAVDLRNTTYTQQDVPTASGPQPVVNVLNRRTISASAEIRPPTLEKVFDHPFLGRKVKHTVEPYAVYTYTNGIENFASVIRFDFRDILSNTNEVEYGLVQRLYFKRIRSGCDDEKEQNKGETVRRDCTPAGANDFITWELKQKYFLDTNFGGAVVNGVRNVFTTTDALTGIAFVTQPRRFSPIVSRLNFRTSGSSDVGRDLDLGWALDYDTVKGRINSSTLYSTFHFGNYFVGGSEAYMQDVGEIVIPPGSTAPLPPCAPGGLSAAPCIPQVYNQVRALVGYGSPSKRGWSAAANVGYDFEFKTLQYGAAQAAYNWDCCGIAVEYRRFSLGTVRPNENQYRFAFTLANIGTFGNMKRQERLF